MLSPGTRLGPYEIVSPAGQGGMGEVYKAADTRLNRTVALKILPHHLSENDEMRQRFEREAQTVASLNHPNICTLHDVGHQDGVDFLVMEYVEGDTLATRLERGPIPIADALRIAIQMADALDKAHRQAVVHRDFKPGNVMLPTGGTRSRVPQAKLLDFGLAKLRTSGPTTPITVTAAPTNAKDLTMVGSVMGTLQYMAPEQIEGKEADARTDIFALGATLYEMLTGQKAFQGKSQVSLIASILEHDPPPMTALQPIVPASLEGVVRGCLAKDPDERWQSARDVVRQLTWISDHLNDISGAQSVAAVAGRGIGTRERLMWGAVTAAALLIAGAIGARVALRDDPAPPPIVRFDVASPSGHRSPTNVPRFAVSPDGVSLAFTAVGREPEQFWLRRLDSSELRPLQGTQAMAGEVTPQSPFWSPDGRTLGYFVTSGIANSGSSRMKAISLEGGAARELAVVPSNNASATWNESDVILVASSGTDGVQRISANGGVPVQVTTLDASRNEIAHLWPQFLPDGRHFIFQAQTVDRRQWSIWVASTESPERKMLVASEFAQFAAPDLLLYSNGNVVLADHLDLTSLTLRGEPRQALESVAVNVSNGRAAFAVSQSGVLVHAEADDRLAARQLTWYNGKGGRSPTGIQVTGNALRLSPDDKRVVLVEGSSGNADLYVYDLERGGVGSRLTADLSADRSPVWIAGGTQIAFSSNRTGRGDTLFAIGSTGATPEQRILEFDHLAIPLDAARDGLVVFVRGNAAPRDLWYLPAGDNREPVRYLTTPFDEVQAALSPDGASLAYAFTDGTRSDVIVQSFPDPSVWRLPISTEGGSSPRWRRDGRELYYRDLSNRIVAVSFQPGLPPKAGLPVPVFTLPVGMPPAGFGSAYPYDVAGDGRFLVSERFDVDVDPLPPLTVTLNWNAGR